MSERILRALMQLFAIIAKVELVPEKTGEGDDEEDVKIGGGGRNIVELFLKQRLNQKLVEEYLEVFDQYLEKHQKISKRKYGEQKRTSVNSVKVLRICTDINAELTQKQKLIVLLRLIEFIKAEEEITDQEIEFVTTVAETFNIQKDEFERLYSFVFNEADTQEDSPYLLYIDAQEDPDLGETKHMRSEGLAGQLRVQRIPSVNMYIFRYFGKNELYLNGQIINNRTNYVLTHGASIRSSLVQPIYYSDIINSFLSDTASEHIVFKADHISYSFPNGAVGLHDLSLTEESGKLCGIMGGSGAGKSTLLNVLNGKHTPTTGSITINGIDLHRESEEIEGVVGFISQDDLLIEELTVFQNLFYNTKLCFSDRSDPQIAKMVMGLLQDLGLYEIRDLKVGSPLDKTISGGQRKRLNIALELIREPSVLFVDEPTSGLSSRDSENIMDLLKELALKGKLVFVVIHQPSSDLFKMFDKLLLLDQGGYPIYNGNPVDSIVYFKRQIDHINSEESECPTCGNVNPEQIFNIIESKVVDEFGNLTSKRKVEPEEWYDAYKEHIGNEVDEKVEDPEDRPQSTFKVPNLIKQFRIFSVRDMLAKFTNKQYLGINFLEAPVLAAILSFFVKFYAVEEGGTVEYVFRENVNIPPYLFIAVIVALFLGLTVSAEEIIRDRKILERESFLNLSKGSYLFSKIGIMFIISAVQTFLYTIVGNLILEIQGMTFSYFLLLFSIACFANLLGLNISASFNSAKVIYILIPLLIIPQLLFAGVIVKFDKLHPAFSEEAEVPWIGNIMASRWAFEALSVTQFKDNDFEEELYPFDKKLRSINWEKDYWIREMRNILGNVREKLGKKDKGKDFRKDLALLRHEFKEKKKEIRVAPKSLASLNPGEVTEKAIDQATNYLDRLFETYRQKYNETQRKKEAEKEEWIKENSKEAFKRLKNNCTNDELRKFVTKSLAMERIVRANGELIQKSNPIYKDPIHSSFFEAHFYAPTKNLWGRLIDTFWANLMVIWGMTAFLIVTLYFDALRKLIAGVEKLGKLFR
ncbi:MAG: ATP-binding cassette domain-containing protein [Flavobacteriales bacterium]